MAKVDRLTAAIWADFNLRRALQWADGTDASIRLREGLAYLSSRHRCEKQFVWCDRITTLREAARAYDSVHRLWKVWADARSSFGGVTSMYTYVYICVFYAYV